MTSSLLSWVARGVAAGLTPLMVLDDDASKDDDDGCLTGSSSCGGHVCGYALQHNST